MWGAGCLIRHVGGYRSHPRSNEPLRALFESQHGVVTRRQLRALGLSDDAIDGRVRKGSLARVGRGVFAAGHGALTDRGRWMTAVLGCVDGTQLSHRSAAALWGMVERASPIVDVTALRTARGGRRGNVIVHRSGALGPAETTRRHGIPVTRPTRTALDLAEVVDRRALERALDAAQRLGLCSERQLRDAVRRNPGRLGATRLAAVLDEHALGSTATANDFEEAFLALCDEHGIERPEVNVPLLGRYRADFLWRTQSLVVETDGYATHTTHRAFESDHERDIELRDAGWEVRRFTWRQLVQRPGWVAGKVREVLGA